MASSFLHIFLLPLCLLLSLQSIRAAAKPAPATTEGDKEGIKHIQDSCKQTDQAKLCLDSLLTFPESRTADPRQMAALALRFAANQAAETTAFASKMADNAGDKSSLLQQCLSDCVEHFEDAVDQLDTSTSALDKKALKDVQAWVSAVMSDATSCNEGCEDAGETTETVQVKKKSNLLFDLCGIALALSRLVK